MTRRIEKYHHHPSSAERSRCKKAPCMLEAQELDDYLCENPDLNAMCAAFEGWMREHELSSNLVWLTPDQWSELDYGDMFDGAKLILIFEESELVDFFNYMGQNFVISGLSEVVGKFSYSGVLGHIWNMGFYPKTEESLSASLKKVADDQEVVGRQACFSFD